MSLRTFVQRHPYLRLMLAGPRAVRRSWLRHQERGIHELLGRLESLLPEDVILRVDEFDADFACSAKSHLFRRVISCGSYEPTLARIFFESLQPDADVLDIGANIGFYTVGGARKLRAGRVLAAEPTDAAFARLRSNVARNGVTERVVLYKGLIGAAAGEGAVNSVLGREEYSSTGNIDHPSAQHTRVQSEKVPMDTLDRLVDKYQLKPAVLKVDVEGAESAVFAGANHVLSVHRPIVISEIANPLLRRSGTDGREIVGLFHKLDYHVVDPHDPLATPGAAEYTDIVCTPKERLALR